MENDFTTLVEQFLSDPLVTWVKTFGALAPANGGALLEYMELADGIFLSNIMVQINPKSTNARLNKKINNDISLRIQNLSSLVQNIKLYYQETLQQLIMMSLPNVLVLGRTPLSECGINEMKKLLLLLLGCTVQCERKEEFIERIKNLDFDTKAAVAIHIQEVTHNQENVFDMQWVDLADISREDLNSSFRKLAVHLKRIVDERDEKCELILQLAQERDCSMPPTHGIAQSPTGSPGMQRTESRQHLSVELADTKAKLRRIRQEMEEKTEQLLDSKQEIEQMEVELKRLQQENLQLQSDARSARTYRDELDSLREKAFKVDKLESAVNRYKDRLHDVEFYKTRTEELKEDNKILLETKIILEDQLEGARARCDKLHEFEKENLQLMAKMHDMEMEHDTDRKRIEELMEENLSLEMAQKQSMDESLHLGWELEQLSKTTEFAEGPHKSLGQEVNELTSSRLLKMEKENQALLKTMEELRIAVESTDGCNFKFLELEKENQRLKKKVERLKGEISSEKQSMQNVEKLTHDLIKEKSQLEKSIESIQENSERQIKVLEQENEHLNYTIASLRQRAQISVEAGVKDIEKENKILHESIKETSSKLNKIEFEKKLIQKELGHYKEKGERAEELEIFLSRLESENEQLQKKITGLMIMCEKIDILEREISDLEVENNKLRKTLNSLKNLTVQLDILEKENTQLDDENLQLRRTLENLKSNGVKLAQLELENKELENEKERLKKNVDILKACNKKSERLEVSYQGLDLENHRLQKALDNSSKKINQMENELQDLETENQSLQRNLEELKISSKRLQQLEKENKLLEQETIQLEKDKKQLEKENRRLRQQTEVKDSTLDENNMTISNLEKENKLLTREITKFKDFYVRLKDLEKDNKELVKQATIDKRTLVTLREELVNEKLHAQQMSNDLEKLTHELEKIGLNKERLLHDEQTTDDSRYKLLASKLESTLKKSLEIKEEKIASLEARLEESTNLNQQIRQELKTVKKNYEALKQRQEEERNVQNSQYNSVEEIRSTNKWEQENQEVTRELLKVKDRLIEIERNNATLQAEKQALKTQLKQLETQNNNLQSQILSLQKQTTSLQVHNTTLQTENAKLQVEHSTLGSQSASLMTQNSQLQNQQLALENENEILLKEKDELKLLYDSLVKDHEKLAKLHEHQATEYESLINKHGSLKSAHKNLEVEHKDLEDRYNELVKQKGQLEELETILKKEQEKMRHDAEKHDTTVLEYQKICNENARLNQINSHLLKENEGFQLDHKNLKSLLNGGKLEHARLEADFAKLKEQYQQLDISSTKLSNQCELLSQLKGNLEEENRHLLDQIQTLMLHNKSLLEQSMESKDLFHVEQRQYIDKLNELRRQKEKLEEKIMDQYKFYEPSPPRRRGNWIAIKMKKLIKHKKEVNRERIKSLTSTPTRSESSDGFLQLPQHDSQDSSSVGSNSLDEGHSAKKSSMATLKRLPFMRNRPKDKDKMKALYRRSMSMNDLLQSMISAGVQWSASSENLEESNEVTGGQRTELGSMAFSTTAVNLTTTSSAGFRSHQRLQPKGVASNEDLLSDEPNLINSCTGSRSKGRIASPEEGGKTSASKNNFQSTVKIFGASRPASLDSSRTSSSNNNNNASAHDAKAGAANGRHGRFQSLSTGKCRSTDDSHILSNSSRSSSHLPQNLKKDVSFQKKEVSIADTQKRSLQRNKTTSPGSEVVTLQQFLEESNINQSSQVQSEGHENFLDSVFTNTTDLPELIGTEKLNHNLINNSTTTGLPRGRENDSFSSNLKRPGQYVKPSPRNSDHMCIKGSSEDTFLSQGKTVSMCKLPSETHQSSHIACTTSTLPRASHVISTAEGSSRRTSIHEFMSRDSRAPVSIDPSPGKVVTSTQTLPSEYQVNHYHQTHFAHHVAYHIQSVSNLQKSQLIQPYGDGQSLIFDLNPVNTNKIFSASNSVIDQITSNSASPPGLDIVSGSIIPESDPIGGRASFTNVQLSSSTYPTGMMPQKPKARPTDIALVSPIKIVQPQEENKSVILSKSTDELFKLENQESSGLSSLLISDPSPSGEEGMNISVSPSVMSEDKQTVWYEYGCI
ncbi:girdin isoform X6 [Amblyraja radiata]|uniref:girdin isoform X6 n=1 Tax=Amblyraja radiata TaxID=386614 RepID=UPI0014029EE1|nr:girdin isoform X6 [Amblyraja radiata]